MILYARFLDTVALIARLIWLPLGHWLALAIGLLLSWLTEGARPLAQLPYAAVQLPPFPLWLLLGYYIIVVGGWFSTRWSHRALSRSVAVRINGATGL